MLGKSTSRGTKKSHEEMRRGLGFLNTSLWDAFYKEMGKRPLRFSEQLQAMMQLHHPQKPNPWPMFEWWRKAREDQTHPLHAVVSRTASVTLVEVGRDVRLVLEHQGNYKEAQWLKSLLSEIFPKDRVFLGKSRRERLSVEGKPLPSFQSPRNPEKEDFSESP